MPVFVFLETGKDGTERGGVGKTRDVCELFEKNCNCIYSFKVCVCLPTRRSEDNMLELVLSFQHVGPGD